MSAWIVYSKDGSVERCELKSLEYGGTAMGERAVTATFDSNSEVDFEVFDYIEYRGEKFELEAVPTVKKVSSFEYIYELRFVSLKYELERCEMRDLVPYDNEVVYPTPLTFSFTGNVRYLTERIQACLDALYGSGTWNIIIADGVESEEKNITIAQQNCWNALALVSSTYGLSFYIKGRTITIGGEQPLVGHTFEYGKGNGLYEIERASDTNTGIVTKLRAYGGTRNLDYSYPKRPEWSDSALPVTFAFSPLRLMLPSFKYDGKTDYVLADSATIAKYGIREASMVYDDIYPSITGATHNGQAIDEIKAVEEVDDNAETFVVYLHDLGFDLEEHLTTSDAQISMKTGAMQGYTFTMSVIEKQEDNSYKITLGRISAEGGDNYNIPNSDWSMKAGDKFVLLNILMPQMYIREAENRLKERAEEYLAQYGKTNFSYNIGLHDKFLIENPSVYASLIEGSKLRVRDSEIGIDEEVTIQSITITENAEDNILPQVKVTLNNEPSASTLERIQGRIDALANESAAGNFATQSEIMAQYRKKLDKPYFDKLFVAVDANGKDIPSNDMTTPVAYIKAKYHFAVVGGITSFVDDVDLDLPSIYDGLPIDYQTLYWDEIKEEVGTDEEGNPIYKTTKVLKANVGSGGSSEGGSGGGSTRPVQWSEIENKPSWLTDDKVHYSEVEGTPDLGQYAQKTWVNSQGFLKSSALGDIESAIVRMDVQLEDVKNSYATKKYVDDIVSNLSGGSGGEGSVADSIHWNKVYGKPYWLEDDEINYSDISDTPDLSVYATSEWVNSQGFLKQSSLANYATIDYVDELVSNLGGGSGGGTSSGSLSVGESGSGNAYTGYTYLNGKLTLKKEVTFAESAELSALADSVANKADKSSVYTKTEIDNALTNYVTVKDDERQTIEGEKNFTGGLFVNDKQIKYNSKGYWELEGDLLVTGGITSFASSSGFNPSTIMDGVVVDGVTIIKQNGVLVAVGSGSSDGGGSGDFPDLSAYALMTWVEEGFATSTQLSAVDAKISEKWTTDELKIARWDAAYKWGNHADEGYVKSSALSETLKDYVTVGGKEQQDITGKKNFTGGLLVNGKELVYNEDGYWKMEGNLLVTGGITSYSSDGKASPFLIDVTEFDEITSNSTTQVYTANAVSLLKEQLDAVDTKADDSDTRISTLKTALGGLSATSLSDLVNKLKTLNF